MKKLALDQNREYYYPIYEDKTCSVGQKQIYGGDDSVTVPCGFIQEMIFKKKGKRKMKNRLEAVASRYVPSLTNIPNG